MLVINDTKKLKIGDILHRIPNVNEISISDSYDDLHERKYMVMGVGNCGKLLLDDLLIMNNILVCQRLDISRFEVIRKKNVIGG